MPVTRLTQLCPSFLPYWVPIFDELSSNVGQQYTVITQSAQSMTFAKKSQEIGSFRRKIITGMRIALADGKANQGLGTPMGLNIAPSLPFHLIKLDPQVVIASNFGLWSMISIVMRYPTVIFWEGTLHTERTVRSWRKHIRVWMAQRAYSFVVNGEAAKEYLITELGVPLEKIFVGGLCAEPPPKQGTSTSARKYESESTVRFVCTGQLIKRKGVAYLIRAVAHLNARFPPGSFELVILGDGPEREHLVELAARTKSDEQIRFVGKVPPDKVWDYYGSAHVFVLPTLQDNWPLVVPEAMSAGLPVLVSKFAGSVPDLIREGVNGNSFDPHDPADIAVKMGRYITDPSLIERHGRNSLRIVSPYTPSRVANVYLDAVAYAYDQVSEGI